MKKERITLEVTVVRKTDDGIILQDQNGAQYHWFTRSYNSPLFYETGNKTYKITASSYTFDHPTPKTGLKHVRIINK